MARDLRRSLAAFLTGRDDAPPEAPSESSSPPSESSSPPSESSSPPSEPTGFERADPPTETSAPVPVGTGAAASSGPVRPSTHALVLPPRPTPGSTATHQPLQVPPGEEGGLLVIEEDPYGEPVVDPRYDLDDRNWVRYRSSWGGFLRLVIIVVLLVLAALWVRGRIYSWIDAQIDPSGPMGEVIDFTIPDGASTNDVASALDTEGIISNATVFRYWLRCEGDITITGFLGCDTERAFQAGDYELNQNMSFDEVVAVLDEGPIPEVFFTITVPEGLRWTEMADRLLDENPEFDRVELQEAFVSPTVASDYIDTTLARPTMEGLLFPSTYNVSEDFIRDEVDLLQRMSNEFDDRFTRLLAEPGPNPVITELGLDEYDVIVVASLIEEEAVVPEERPQIARVIYNRLLNDMLLEIDASICYAVNKSCADLTVDDLEYQSPWNTRVSPGLPPTPIAAPGEDSLRAALAPADGDWLFYVRTDEGGVLGAHHFSETLEEHNENVEICRELGYCG